MNKINRALSYVLERLREPSTWRGLVLVLTAFGANLKPAQWEAIVTLGLGFAGLIGVTFPDPKAPDDGKDSGV